MSAQIVDFQLVYEGDDITAYRFRFGKCDDFAATIATFKGQIHMAERTPYPQRDWMWEVKATPHNRAVLESLFENFELSLERAMAQMPLF